MFRFFKIPIIATSFLDCLYSHCKITPLFYLYLVGRKGKIDSRSCFFCDGRMTKLQEYDHETSIFLFFY